MTVERWRMQSGRTASIDLDGPTDAVTEARELLRMNGATPINEEGPVAVKSDEAEVPATPSQNEENTNMNIIPDSAEVRESIRSWALQYAAKADEYARIAINDPEFQEWAAESIRRFPHFTIDKCARRWVDENGLIAVPWPTAASPEGWNVDVGSVMGGEVTVSVDYEINDAECPSAGASLGVLIAVVVDVDPSRTLPEPGVKVGDYFVSMPTISYWGVEQTSDADADRLRALSRVMLRAADALPAVAEFSRLLGGSERSLEIPVSSLLGEVQP